ncbi:MAG: DUF2188 domain-containing protein [Actinobacteria bacterium]|nr:DUF2188 domain-containing protein [Actinomycetota bacterium]
MDTSGRSDAVDLILEDHATVDELFGRFEASLEGSDSSERAGLARRMVEELRLHAAMEEKVFYPAVRSVLADGDQLVEESLREHQDVKQLLADLEGMSPNEARFDGTVMRLISEVRHHVNEEESEILPKLRTAIGASQLVELGARMQEAKRSRGAVATSEPPVTAKKTTAKKTTAKKTTAKKTTAKKTTAKKKRLTYHVAPRKAGGWEVRAERAKRPSSAHDSKEEAVKRGRQLAQRQRLGQLIVHKRDGSIQTEHTYGEDPRRSKG